MHTYAYNFKVLPKRSYDIQVTMSTFGTQIVV